MSTRVLVAASLLANIALLVMVMRMERPPAARKEAPSPGAEASREIPRLKTNVTRVEITLTNEGRPFQWSDVQSDDLKMYVANLRSIGCPPETVRDIIEGEVNAGFLAQRRVMLEPFHRGYWDFAASGKDFDDTTEPLEAEVEKLDEQRKSRIKAALGSGQDQEHEPERTVRLDYLSEAAQAALEDLQKKFVEEVRKLRPEKGGKMTPELQAKRSEVEAEWKEAVRALLTPAEHAEHTLRSSTHAQVARSSPGFEATPEEARAMTGIYAQFEAADTRLDRKDPNAEARRAQAAEAKRQREEALKQTLGAERFTQFQEGQNGRFQEVYKITRRYELPRDIAAQAAALFKVRDEALQRMRGDKAMPAEERSARVGAAQSELRAALLQTMGERALRTYEKYHGPILPKEPGER